MATQLQKKAVEKLVENGRKGKKLSVSAVMREVGYSPQTAVVPAKLTQSKGFKEICDKYGLTEALILKSLVYDIKKKPKARVKELNLGAEILRMKEEKGTGNTFNTIIFTDGRAQRIARRILAGNPASATKPD